MFRKNTLTSSSKRIARANSRATRATRPFGPAKPEGLWLIVIGLVATFLLAYLAVTYPGQEWSSLFALPVGLIASGTVSGRERKDLCQFRNLLNHMRAPARSRRWVSERDEEASVVSAEEVYEGLKETVEDRARWWE